MSLTRKLTMGDQRQNPRTILDRRETLILLQRMAHPRR